VDVIYRANSRERHRSSDNDIPHGNDWLEKNRCWARAKLRTGYAAYLDSRALVQLRLGKLDVALVDYDAAVKANPRNAWSLYTRAIAERCAGKIDAADADRKAALAINPNVAKRAARYGLDG
jgi:tetratricopeptide (TPR) repeat protein